jgi:hypothetical protein
MTGEIPGKPLLLVVRGNPTPEEIAAVVTVLASRSAPAEPAAARRPSRWADPANRLRQPLRPGTDAWSRSGLPY